MARSNQSLSKRSAGERLLKAAQPVLLAIALGGCSEPKTESISLLGSNTVGEELAPRLTSEYQKDHPGLVFDLEFKGTSYGVGALLVDKCDIAAASRDLTPTERELARDRGIDFNTYVLGSYSVAVVVHASNVVDNLRPDQVRDIFSGAIRNWDEVGGPDAPIQTYIRDPISGTHLGFQELAMDKKPYASGFKALTNYADVVSAVARDPNGIGYSSIFLAQRPGVKPAAIAGVGPSAETVRKGQYPYARVLRLFTNRGKETPTTHDFIEFVLSPRGQEIVEQMGFVPHP